MTPSRTLQVLSLSWLFLGLVSVAALMLLIRTIPKVEWNDASKVATTTAQEVSGSAIYNGLPVGDAELFEALLVNGELDREVLVKAYKAGRLRTGPIVRNESFDRYVQVVRIPGSAKEAEEIDRVREPECGYYGGYCVLMITQNSPEGDSYKMFSDEESHFYGLRPQRFASDSLVVLMGGFGDGPQGTLAYKILDVSTATTTHAVELTTLWDLGIQYTITPYHKKSVPNGGPAVVIHAKPDTDNTRLEDASWIRYQMTIESVVGDEYVKSLIMERRVSRAEWTTIQDPVIDVDAYAINSEELRLSFAGKDYLFDLTDNQIRLKR